MVPGVAFRVVHWKCAHCGDVIGFYEPAIVVEGDGERRTSRLNERHLDDVERDDLLAYHEECRPLAAIEER